MLKTSRHVVVNFGIHLKCRVGRVWNLLQSTLIMVDEHGVNLVDKELNFLRNDREVGL
jgi:hypothetical protein